MQIYLTNWFLGGTFLNLGQLIAEPPSKDKVDPLDIVFPKVNYAIYIDMFLMFIMINRSSWLK